MTEMTLTIPKVKLIEELMAARDAIKEPKEVAHLRELLKDLGEETSTNVLADWYEKVATGLRDGTVTVNRDGGVRGAGQKPRSARPVVTDRNSRYQGYDAEGLKAVIDDWERRTGSNKKPLDVAIKLLELSIDENATINTADYQRLLEGRSGR